MQHFQEKCTLLEEIKKINNLLIDTEVAINEDNPTIAAVASKHGERLFVKCFFNRASVNLKSEPNATIYFQINIFILIG